jgi:hypothetical protein
MQPVAAQPLAKISTHTVQAGIQNQLLRAEEWCARAHQMLVDPNGWRWYEKYQVVEQLQPELFRSMQQHNRSAHHTNFTFGVRGNLKLPAPLTMPLPPA